MQTLLLLTALQLPTRQDGVENRDKAYRKVADFLIYMRVWMELTDYRENEGKTYRLATKPLYMV